MRLLKCKQNGSVQTGFGRAAKTYIERFINISDLNKMQQ